MKFALAAAIAALPALADPPPSWNSTEAKDRIIRFSESVADSASPNWFSPGARIATFDRDGTLRAGKPVYFLLI